MTVKDFIRPFKNTTFKIYIDNNPWEYTDDKSKLNSIGEYNVVEVTVGACDVLICCTPPICKYYSEKKFNIPMSVFDIGVYYGKHNKLPEKLTQEETRGICSGKKMCEFCTCKGNKDNCDYKELENENLI